MLELNRKSNFFKIKCYNYTETFIPLKEIIKKKSIKY